MPAALDSVEAPWTDSVFTYPAFKTLRSYCSLFGDLLSLSALSFLHFFMICGMMSEAFTHVLPPSLPPLLYIRRFQADLNISDMTFTKANNSHGINCYQSCWELPGKVIVARWETGAAVVGGKLNDLHASATAPFMSLIQVQAYPFAPSHQSRTRPSVFSRFALFRFPWANKYVNTCYFKWHTLYGSELEV